MSTKSLPFVARGIAGSLAKRIAIPMSLTLDNSFFTQATFNTVWDTTKLGVSANNQIQIPLVAGETYNFDWETSDGQTGTHTTDSDLIITFPAGGVYVLKIGGFNNIFPHMKFGFSGDKEKLLNVTSWGTVAWESFDRMFYGCVNAAVTALNIPDLTNCSVFSFAFAQTPMNPIVTDWDVSAATSLSFIFSGNATANPDVSKWNTPNLTIAAGAFQGASNANPKVDGWDYSGVTNLAGFMDGSLFNTANYDALLISLDSQTLQSGVELHAGTACYSDGGATLSRNNLITEDLWTIADGGPCNNANIWLGSINSFWHNNSNWSLGHWPTALEVAILSGDESNVDCNVSADAEALGISMQNGYSGFLTQQGLTVDLNIGSSSFYITSGNFNGGGGTINNAGYHAQHGGAFRSTSGVYSLSGGDLIRSNGTFDENGGSVAFVGNGQSININGATLNKIILNFTNPNSDFVAQSDFTFIGLLEILSGAITGDATITMDSNASIRSIQPLSGGIPIGALVWDIIGNGNNEIYSDKIGGQAQVMGGIRVNKSGGALTLYDDIGYGVQNVPLLQYISGTVIYDPTCKIRDVGFNCTIDWSLGGSIPEYVEDKRNVNTIATLLDNFNVDKWSHNNVSKGGRLNIGGFTVNCLGDMDRGGDLGNPFGGSIIVGGNNAWINGDLSAAAVVDWLLSVTGTNTADNCTIKHCDASGGTALSATNSTDNGNNTNVNFV